MEANGGLVHGKRKRQLILAGVSLKDSTATTIAIEDVLRIVPVAVMLPYSQITRRLGLPFVPFFDELIGDPFLRQIAEHADDEKVVDVVP